MTNTTNSLPELRFATARVDPYSESLNALLLVTDNVARIEELFEELRRIRGAHRVTIEAVRDNATLARLYFRGTSRAHGLAFELVEESGLKTDPNADHDHERCLAYAREMGVPAAWAHRVETYLSM